MQSGKHVGQNLSWFVLDRKLCDVSTSEGYYSNLTFTIAHGNKHPLLCLEAFISLDSLVLRALQILMDLRVTCLVT